MCKQVQISPRKNSFVLSELESGRAQFSPEKAQGAEAEDSQPQPLRVEGTGVGLPMGMNEQDSKPRQHKARRASVALMLESGLGAAGSLATTGASSVSAIVRKAGRRASVALGV